MKCLLVLFVVAAVFATGEALKCYQCAESNPKCNDPFDKSADGVSETADKSGCYCVKAVAESGNEKATARGCIDPGIYSMDKSRAGTFDRMSISLCTSDLCNGAGSTTATLVVLAVPLVLMIWH